jgi:hypothetical protein
MKITERQIIDIELVESDGPSCALGLFFVTMKVELLTFVAFGTYPIRNLNLGMG